MNMYKPVKIILPYKYELCENCRKVHVPVTDAKYKDRRLCSNCWPHKETLKEAGNHLHIKVYDRKIYA